MPQHKYDWDGHTTAQKHERIATFVARYNNPEAE